ncbi:MAG: hypothetical protein HN580_03870 [Deltaproteobacteria bacterium]|jgi:hypothetical protein|nr:hypothetical protein [Deltaproteobacteria bacterium]MBT4086992.1 hypothetical protein [Deltaproteobacteria bacterium]MBT4269367.1 hypothetical protein [Deltaproteobacteria bacterium]MBT4638696.1 hypothetical protein [Deltaproteobacteria bacterium]MBT6498980.1 hypothetical protein [Deltaproteobacteria bacterium]
MVIIVESYVPWEGIAQVIEVNAKMPAIADFITARGPYGTSELGAGVKGITLYEFDDARLKEATDAIAKRLMGYIGITDYTWEMKTYYSMEEAVALMG